MLLGNLYNLMQDLRVGMAKQFSYANSHTIIFQLQTFYRKFNVTVIVCACDSMCIRRGGHSVNISHEDKHQQVCRYRGLQFRLNIVDISLQCGFLQQLHALHVLQGTTQAHMFFRFQISSTTEGTWTIR